MAQPQAGDMINRTGGMLNIHQRMAAAMRELPYIRKDDKAPIGYTFVSHDLVTAKVRAVLLKHGVICYPADIQSEHSKHEGKGGKPVFMTQVSMEVLFVNIDDPKDFVSVRTLGTGMDSQDKAVGKAISYAVKYGMLKAMMLETGDDPERDVHDLSGGGRGEDVKQQDGGGYPRGAPDTQAAVDRTQPQCIGIGDIRDIDKCSNLAAFAQDILFFRMDKKGADLTKISLGAYEQAVRKLTELSDEQVEKLRAVDPGTSKNVTRLSRLGAKQYAPWLKLVLDRLHDGLDDRERQWVQTGNFRSMPPDWTPPNDLSLGEQHTSNPAYEARPSSDMANGVFPECQLDRPEGFDLDQEVTIAGTVRSWKDWVRKEPDMLQNLVLSAKRGAGTDTKAWTDIARCALMALRLGNAG